MGRYVLNYDYSADTGRSLLHSVARYGSDRWTELLPRMRFQYAFKGNGYPDGGSCELLEEATNGLGGRTLIQYINARETKDTPPEVDVQVVSSLTVKDGIMGSGVIQPDQVYGYDYEGGKKADGEFKGFGKVILKHPDGTQEVTLYRQDEVLLGKPELITTYVQAANAWERRGSSGRSGSWHDILCRRGAEGNGPI